MNAPAAKVISEGLLKGAFDLFDAMLSLSFSHETGEVKPADAAALEELVSAFPVVLRGKIQNDLGAVALLMRPGDAARIAALAVDGEPSEKEALDDDDRAALLEVASPALGSGVTNLMERFGRNVEQLEDVQVDSPGDAAALVELLGEGARAANFTFKADPGFDGEAVVLFSESLETLVPEDALGEETTEPPPAEEATLTDAEMTDILSGFDAGAQETPGAGETPAPDNLDMVLDIGLVATARLGRVDLPLGEILNLGPGSIIEVGHMVDEPVELLVNGKLIARGDVVVVDEKFGIRITEIVSQRERIESMQ